jgi:hypothetical protein
MSDNKQLTEVGGSGFELATVDVNIAELLREELGGIGRIPFDEVKIPVGGATQFAVGDDEDDPEYVAELSGIIVDHHPVNAMWAAEYTGAGVLPDCSSFDGITGITADGEARGCGDCPYNQFNTALKGKGKLCKNMHRIYLLRSGEIMPLLLTLPPSSLGAWKNYIGKRVVLRGKRSYHVITNITLRRVKIADGFAYSQAVFARGADLSPAEIEAITPTVEGFKKLTRSAPMQASDTVTAEATEQRPTLANPSIPYVGARKEGKKESGMVEVGDGDELPF